jgi:hypothetical protein
MGIEWSKRMTGEIGVSTVMDELEAIGMPRELLEGAPGAFLNLVDPLKCLEWPELNEIVPHLIRLAEESKIAILHGNLQDPELGRRIAAVLERWRQRAGAVRLSNVLEYVFSAAAVARTLSHVPALDGAQLITSASERLPAEKLLGRLKAPRVRDLTLFVDGEEAGMAERAIWQEEGHIEALWSHVLEELLIPRSAWHRPELACPKDADEALERLEALAASGVPFEREEGTGYVENLLRDQGFQSRDLATHPVRAPANTKEVSEVAHKWLEENWTHNERLEHVWKKLWAFPSRFVPEALIHELANDWITPDGLNWASEEVFEQATDLFEESFPSWTEAQKRAYVRELFVKAARCEARPLPLPSEERMLELVGAEDADALRRAAGDAVAAAARQTEERATAAAESLETGLPRRVADLVFGFSRAARLRRAERRGHSIRGDGQTGVGGSV